MSEFTKDNNWARQMRDKHLKPLYRERSAEGRFVFCDKGRLAREIQRMSVDTIMQGIDGEICGVEEKIRRWPIYRHRDMALETKSCSVAGHETPGWMYTAKCKVLLYCFEQKDGRLLCFAVPFAPLRDWFFEDNRFLQYGKIQTTQFNHSECRVVPLKDILRNIGGCRVFWGGSRC